MWPLRRSLAPCAVVLLSLLLCGLLPARGTEVEAQWKPRQGPANRYPQRGRFFLPNPCVLQDDKTGAHFDLTSLRRTGSDYTASDSDYFYRMNVCGPVNAGGPCGNALVCQYSKSDQRFVAKIAVYDGYFGPRLTLVDPSNPGAGVQAQYLNGDVCFLGPTKRRNPRTTIMRYKCAASTKDTFTVEEDKNTCTFTITLETNKACWPPGSAPGAISRGTMFLILLVLVILLYLGLGIFYNRNQGAEGKDQIPHLEFWSSTLPELVKDGCRYSWSKFQDFKESRLKNGSGGLLGGSGEVDPDDPFGGKGAPTARTDDL